MSSNLFTPFTLRSVTFPNHLGIPPMCLFVAKDGFVNDIHVANYSKYAQLGFGCIIQEATAVGFDGRISRSCLGIWNDEFIPGLKRIVDIVHYYGSKIGIQLHHAGRKASTYAPFESSPKATVPKEEGGWDIISCSPIAYDDRHATPKEMTLDEVKSHIQLWADAAKRAVTAGYDFIEIHAAHGFLLHEFLSPLTNHRSDM